MRAIARHKVRQRCIYLVRHDGNHSTAYLYVSLAAVDKGRKQTSGAKKVQAQGVSQLADVLH